MPTRGTLKRGGVAKALELISETSATGVLDLRVDGQRTLVHCQDGRIVNAFGEGSDINELLADLLAYSGALERTSIDEARREAQGEGADLLGALERRLGEEELRRITYVLVTDPILDAFVAPRGRWSLDDRATTTPFLGEGIPARDLIPDGRRVLEESPIIDAVVDNPRLRFKRIRSLDGAVSLGPNDHFVYGLVRQDRDVRDVEQMARLGRFEVRRALYQLTASGYIAPQGLSHRGGPITPAQHRRARRQRVVHALANLALLCAVAACALFVTRTILSSDQRPVRGSVSQAEYGLQAQLGHNQAARIHTAIQVLGLHSGVQPKSLDDVVKAGLLRADDLTYPMFEEAFHFEREGERSYRLIPPLR